MEMILVNMMPVFLLLKHAGMPVCLIRKRYGEQRCH